MIPRWNRRKEGSARPWPPVGPGTRRRADTVRSVRCTVRTLCAASGQGRSSPRIIAQTGRRVNGILSVIRWFGIIRLVGKSTFSNKEMKKMNGRRDFLKNTLLAGAACSVAKGLHAADTAGCGASGAQMVSPN